MRVSIIIPVYNVAPFIIRCLDSVVSQSYHEIECILIDDCGTDDSVRIAEKFIDDYHGNVCFKVLHHDENKGLSAARNTGIRNASGDYVYFLDSDDAITPDCIDVLAMLATNYPQADFVQGNMVTNSKELMPTEYIGIPPEFCDEKEKLEELILVLTATTATNKLIKCAFLKQHSLYFPPGIVMEDTYWSYFLAKASSAAAFSNRRTYLYYRNNSSTVNTRTKEMIKKKATGILAGINAFYNDMHKNNQASQIQKHYLCSNMVICMSSLSTLRSILLWSDFWRLVWKMAIHPITKYNIYYFLLILFMFPPLCFLAYYYGWRWRMNQYIVSKL